jgi:hypothetical protein
MTDTTPGCWPDASKPGVPMNPERTAPHWFRTPEGHDVIVWWHCEATSMWWDRPVQAMRLTYLGPCHTPAEVAALKAERDRLLKALGDIERITMSQCFDATSMAERMRAIARAAREEAGHD